MTFTSGDVLTAAQLNDLTIDSLVVDTNVLVVDKTNNRVGVGTASPSAELEVRGASNPEIRIIASDGTDPALYFGDNTDSVRGGLVFDTSENDFQFRGYNNSTVMTIESDGQVGIGTTSPEALLHVNAGTVNNVATFESTDAGAILSLVDNTTTGSAYVGIRADGDQLSLRAGNSNHVAVLSDGNLRINTSGKSVYALSPTTGTGNDAEWALTFGYYYLRRNSSTAAEKENITDDLGEHLTADMIDSVVPKMWNRINAPGYPEIGPIAEDMDAISPFLASRGTDAEDVPFLTGINKTAYLSLLVLAVKDLRARVATLEA